MLKQYKFKSFYQHHFILIIKLHIFLTQHKSSKQDATLHLENINNKK